MSDIKCPVCNVGYVHESVNHWCCDYEFCPSYDETDTETYDILIRTRKALDVAKDALKTVRRYTAINQFAPKSREAHIVAKKAVAEIKALEQKDEK